MASLAVMIVVGAVLGASCAASAAHPGTPPPAATMALPPAPPTSTDAPQRVNMDEIFPPGKGRDLVLQNCTLCHSFVRIVRGQRTAGRWEGLQRIHRDRVRALSDEDFQALFAYVAENFNDTRPEPKLPPWLLQYY